MLPRVTSREERLAKNEAVLREINEGIREGARSVPGERAIFLCECGQPECEETISLTQTDYEGVRADPRRFFMIPGHEQTDIEEVVEHRDSYVVTEKFGRAGEIAEEADTST